MNSSIESAARLCAAGLSVIPIKTDGSKAPALSAWKQFEQRQPTDAELQKWFGNGQPRGIAIIHGQVSGNTEVFDIDAPELIEDFRALVEEAAPGLLARLPRVCTPRAGWHVYYRCAAVEGNRKLALQEREVPADTPKAYQREGRWLKVFTLIETRGEGGYTLAPGSPVECHESRKPYELINGDLTAIPEITPAEREILLTCARSFNEHTRPAQHVAPEQQAKATSLKPGADFNQRGDVRALLAKHGWQQRGKSRAGERWQRPGGDRPSATLFHDGKFYVFSTNAAPLEFDKAYSSFALFAQLDHSGDFQAAAKALAAQGFGEPAKPKEPKKAKQPVKARIGDVTFTVVEDGDLPGVYATDADGNRDFICSPLFVRADTRDEHNGNWGRLLEFPDRDGHLHQWPMPMELLSSDGREYRAELLRQGLVISAARKSRTLLETYLSKKPEKTVLCVGKQGWQRGVYVLPDECLGEAGEPVYLQTASGDTLFRTAGTLDDWRANVGRYCSGNSRLLLAASIGFAASLLSPLHGESGGWHLQNNTSVGKSTALYVAGSVNGGGGDKGFLRRWRATVTGVEMVALAHNDGLLCLDEIAECRPDDVNEIAYMLANGQGKLRGARYGGLRATASWRVAFLSSGEITLADHLAKAGHKVKGGQEVRVINLPADAGQGFGLFENLHHFEDGKAFSEYLQQAAKEYYGTPLRAFVRAVAASLGMLPQRYRAFERELLAEMLPTGAAREVGRVASRFALAAFAGELATEHGLTGWEPDEAAAAAKTLFAAWLAARGTVGSADAEAAIRQIRLFIEQHGASRFQRLGVGDERTLHNRAGYLEMLDDSAVYYFSKESFRAEVCQGYDATQTAKSLEKRGFLLTNHGLQFKRHDPESGKTIPFYAVKSAILE